jgi:hypothetical protein
VIKHLGSLHWSQADCVESDGRRQGQAGITAGAGTTLLQLLHMFRFQSAQLDNTFLGKIWWRTIIPNKHIDHEINYRDATIHESDIVTRQSIHHAEYRTHGQGHEHCTKAIARRCFVKQRRCASWPTTRVTPVGSSDSLHYCVQIVLSITLTLDQEVYRAQAGLGTIAPLVTWLHKRLTAILLTAVWTRTILCYLPFSPFGYILPFGAVLNVQLR